MSGRAATTSIIEGKCALSVGDPGTPVPEGWARVPLLSIAELGTGHTPSRSRPEYWDGGVPWIAIPDARDNHTSVITETSETVSQLGLENSAARILPSNTVGLSRTASVGYVFIMGRPMATSQDFVTWTCSEALDPRFLMYALLAEGDDIRKFGKGSTHTTIYFPEVKAFNLTLAPKPEQRRIVSKLDNLRARASRAHHELDRVPKLIERYKQALLAKAFSGELTADWRDRNDVDVGETVSLESIAEDFSYGSSAKSSPVGRVPVLRMGNIQDGKLDWTNLVFTSDADEIKKYSLRVGDVLFNRTNSPELVGKTALYSGDREAIYAGYLIRIRCSERLLPSYLTYALNSPQGRDYCWQVKTDGVSQSNVNAKKLAAFHLLLPSLEEQREIVRRIDHALNWLDKIATEHACAQHLLPKLDQAILSKAFRGKLVPQDPNDEPASELLQRIKTDVRGGASRKRR